MLENKAAAVCHMKQAHLHVAFYLMLSVLSSYSLYSLLYALEFSSLLDCVILSLPGFTVSLLFASNPCVPAPFL